MSINLDFLDKKFQDLVAKGNFLQITKATQNLEAQSTFRLGTNSVRALTRVSSGEDILVFKNDSDGLLYAIAGRREESRVINQRTILSRHTRPFRNTPGILGLLETFVIRIENPKVDDIHVLDPHQFWGVKVKDIRIVGGELEFILRKEGETDKVLNKGGTVPKDWGLLVKVKALEDEELPPGSTEELKKVRVIVCSMLLEHKSGHRTGWEAIPFNSNQTESGSYTIVADLPYPATLLALEGVPSEFEYTLSYGESLDDTQVVDPEVLAENGVDIPANSSVFVEFEHDGSEETPVFVGSLLLKKQGQERRILERLTCTFLATEDGDYDISHQFYPVSIEGIEPEQVEDPPPEEGTLTIRFFIRPSEGEDIPIVFSEEVTKINAPKNSVIFASIENLTGFSLFTATFWLRRKS